ncbi:MAG: hypothetical protein PVI07_13915, partial [Anaerolineae bacterium]
GCSGSPPCTMHVGDLDGSSGPGKNDNFWEATVTITVYDGNGNPMGGVAVNGIWSSGTADACGTDANGTCVVTSGDLDKDTYPEVTFTVSSVTDPPLSYDPSANTDPDGDSDGTQITVPQ